MGRSPEHSENSCDGGRFSLKLFDDEGPKLVRVCGELDADAQLAFEELAGWLGDADLVLDLTEVTYIDALGLRAVVDARERVERNGYRVVVVRPHPANQRGLRLEEAGSPLPIVDTLAEAHAISAPKVAERPPGRQPLLDKPNFG